jgi:uncharacterized protein (DUF4415 family)
MKKKMAHIEIDLTSPPELTIAQKEELRTLGLKPESEIDTTDIPTLDESFWKNAVQNPFYKPTKTSTTVRIDSDVLHWFRSHGKGYQTRINAVLRHEMLASFEAETAKR